MKLGINLSIDVTKLDKERIYSGKNGAKYVNLTCFISPDEPDQFGYHGGIKEATTKEERAQCKDKELPFVGNVKVFWAEGVTIAKEAPVQSAPALNNAFPDDDIPF